MKDREREAASVAVQLYRKGCTPTEARQLLKCFGLLPAFLRWAGRELGPS